MRALVAAAIVAAAPAVAETPVRAADLERLLAFDAIFGVALRAALATGSGPDAAVLIDAMRGVPGEIAPEGEWACRTIKLGGEPALTVYGNFRCRITPAADGGWRIVKETGSQLFEGTIYPDDAGAIFLGVAYVRGGPATDYAGLPPRDQTPVEPGQTVAQVGRFEQMGGGRARLLLPAPILESLFDIIYFTR
jgi:hypothetical protein